jgi:hypothetical protein
MRVCMSKQQKLSIKAIIALIFVFAGLVSVIAYGTSNPTVFGHSAGEIDFTGMSGNVVTTGDVQGSRVCIGSDCRSAWPTSTTTVSGADPNANTNINAIWNFIQGTLFHENIRFTDANEGIVFYGGGESITGSADHGIDFKSQNGQVRMKVNNDGRIEVFDRLCLDGDCRSSWPSTSSSSAQVVEIQTTVGVLESGCHPAGNSAFFMNTCGHRYCSTHGYTTGFVVEMADDVPSAAAQVSCFA